MNSIMNCPFIPIASTSASHRGAQGVIYASMLHESGENVVVNFSGKIEDHNQYDRMYVYHGSDWNGSMNLYGGVKGFPYVGNTLNFSKFKGEVISLGLDFPPYHEMIKSKIEASTSKDKEVQPEWFQVDIDNLERMYREATRLDTIISHPRQVVGDSHAICMYRPGWMVNSVPYQTLHGALKKGLDTFIEPELDSVELYFGNIDIRHHLCRIGDDFIKNAYDLADRYLAAAQELKYDHIGLYEPLPIETEDRRVPKTGYYDGRPFTGTWKERDDVRRAFADRLESKSSGRVKLIRWVDYLMNSNGMLDTKFMERPQSVHLSREHYPYWTGANIKLPDNQESIFE